MDIYTSYFYQIRFFEPYMIPLSTAVWDPKWYHNFKGQDHIFQDKRGVVNGVRFESFAPDKTCEGLCCGLKTCPTRDPSTCAFLQAYSKQLDRVHYHVLMGVLQQLSVTFAESAQLSKPIEFVFIVHEAEDNPCSERVAIQNWFRKHGHPIQEWHR